MTDELEVKICEGVVSSVANHGWALDKEMQKAWLEIARVRYDLTLDSWVRSHPSLAAEVSGNPEHPYWGVAE